MKQFTKKISAAEMKSLLSEKSSEYEEKLYEQRGRITELTEENKKLQSELELYKNKEDSIVHALVKSEESAKEISEKSEEEYALAGESLKKFERRWKGYFENLLEKYPMYPAVKQASDLSEALAELLKTGNNKAITEALGKRLAAVAEGGMFDPKRKIDEYIAATSESGFSLDEVLNPGELHLEDLCKELGLYEEEQ